MRRVLTIVTLGLLFGLAVPVSGAETADLTISPNPIRLQAGNRRQTVRVQDGLRDVTRLVQWESQAPDIAAVVEGRVVGGDAGTTELTATVSGKTATVVVEVASGSAYPPLHFENDIVPLFSKLGCNGGGCHGKAVGQNGFKLSVFGYDPASDHNAVVKEARGRRIFPADPRQSLLIRKATGVSPHGGGARCAADSNDAQLLEAWIDQGAPLGDDDAPTLSHIEIAPAEVIAAMNAEYQLLVTAVYSDMSRRDVTFAASYAGNAEAVAACEQNGLVRTGERPGEAAITVNYMGQVGAARFITPKPRVVAAPTPEPFNKIDSFVWSKLDKLGISASELCDDATFYRRLHLDAIGTLPAVDDTRAFLASSAADKRQRAIEQVFKRREYADYWALKWADILLVDQSTLGDRGAYEFHRWLRAQMAVNRPYDAWVRDLLMATGNSAKYGPVNLYRALRTKEDLAKSVSQAFLGIRMDCAQCHHHPFEKWSQADFFGLAGYFNGIQRTQVSAGRELVFHQGRQETRMPLTNAIVTTRPPDGPPLPTGEAGDPRTHLATWITDADNPWFARVAVNRLWKQFFGRGLVEPEDDLRSTNPATNERLLDYLADELVAHDFDLKHVMRLITSSRAYQLSSRPNASNGDDEQNFSHYFAKRLPAEVLLDAISSVTGSPERFAGAPLGARSIEQWDNRLPSYFLDTFGRSERQSPCECAKSSDPTMAQALHLMNAPEIEKKISNPTGRAAQLIKDDLEWTEVVDQLCLAALGRPAGERERVIATRLRAESSKKAATEDLVWTLLNSYDFLFID